MRILHKKIASRSEDFGDLTVQLRHSAGITPASPSVSYQVSSRKS